MAISSSQLEFLLARSDVFTGRVQISLTRIAATVLVETGGGAIHPARAAYAKYVMASPAAAANIAAIYLAQSTNVAGTITMEDAGATTSVTDSALESQIATDWNKLAGIDLGS
jgi:hypothetical protein